MYIIGYIGLFFARLIKAAVSRQREYLADAAAVQFTRNPGGIGGALKKIGGLSAGSLLQAPEAETASHMFFGNAIRGLWFPGFATHPPLPGPDPTHRSRRSTVHFPESNARRGPATCHRSPGRRTE